MSRNRDWNLLDCSENPLDYIFGHTLIGINPDNLIYGSVTRVCVPAAIPGLNNSNNVQTGAFVMETQGHPVSVTWSLQRLPS
jgi:hypothetical protein